jgi:hypothetical protein
VGSIPDNYDRGLGPHVFVDYAADLAQRVASLSPSRVLELAAGAGIVTRALPDAFPDKDNSYRETCRVLSPRGRHLFNVWDACEYNPFARIAHETIGRFLPADVPSLYRVPFGYHQIDPIKASLLAV